MKINKAIVIVLLISLLAFAVASQLSPITETVSKTSQIAPSIALEERQTCVTEFYDETQEVYDNCIYYHNFTTCLNTSGQNTDCSLQQATRNFRCKTGEVTVTNNRTACRPNNEFIITIDKGTAVLKKQIDFSTWGPCVYNEENSCLIVTCQSIYDGANDGQFHGCKSGTSCQKFQICDESIKTFYKNSRNDYAEYDPSFYLPELALKEAGK